MCLQNVTMLKFLVDPAEENSGLNMTIAENKGLVDYIVRQQKERPPGFSTVWELEGLVDIL